jgi:hypothetical protein
LALALAFSVPAALCHTALLSSGAVTSIVRVTVINTLQSVLLVAFGASQGLVGVGVAMTVAAAVTATIWLVVTSRHIGVGWGFLLAVFGKSASVAAFAAVGPVSALWFYGSYPAALWPPLFLGGLGGLLGFVGGVLLLQHPLCEEFLMVWRKISRSRS